MEQFNNFLGFCFLFTLLLPILTLTPTCLEPQARLLVFGVRGNATPISGQWGFYFNALPAILCSGRVTGMGWKKVAIGLVEPTQL